MTSVELLRVVAVSPGDVQAECDVLQRVIDELNRGVAASLGRRLSLSRWETDARPGLHLQGPQGLIDEIMDIPEADLVIGVFWKRFGTPTHDSCSGTEHELHRARAAWQESGRILGAECPDTLRARANLAVSHQAAGRTDDAIALGERVLADSERILGAEHPDTLRARANLAGSYQTAGRTHDAIALGEPVLADRERILGAEHPTASAPAPAWPPPIERRVARATRSSWVSGCWPIASGSSVRSIRTRASLAASYRAAGRTNDAIELGERVLADRERILGPEHPDTLSARASLAASARSAGRARDAIAIEQRVLAQRERILGPEHPHTPPRAPTSPPRIGPQGALATRSRSKSGCSPIASGSRRRASRHAQRRQQPRRHLPLGRPRSRRGLLPLGGTHRRRDQHRDPRPQAPAVIVGLVPEGEHVWPSTVCRGSS